MDGWEVGSRVGGASDSLSLDFFCSILILLSPNYVTVSCIKTVSCTNLKLCMSLLAKCIWQSSQSAKTTVVEAVRFTSKRADGLLSQFHDF